MEYIIARSERIILYSDFRKNKFKLLIPDKYVLSSFLDVFGGRDEMKADGIHVIDKSHENELMRFVDEVLASENTEEY